MGIIRDSFVIYAEWDKAIRKAPEDIQLECYHALMDYARTGEMPKDLSWGADMFMTSIQSRVDSVIKKYQASVENGKKGGRPKTQETQDNQNETEENPNETQNNPTKTQENPSESKSNLDEPNPNLNEHVHVNVHVIRSKIKNINNKLKARACTREDLFAFYNEQLKELYSCYPLQSKEIDEMIADVVHLILKAQMQGEFVFKGNSYTALEIFELTSEASINTWGKIIGGLVKTQVADAGLYVFGAILNEISQKSGREVSDD